ncbi:MAG TPA: nuclear transport factor 2 family protein [Acidimicrobiia bacterium]|nr:nuclear transport factor 2 family protein [Acidimicrobiia bacterium]
MGLLSGSATRRLRRSGHTLSRLTLADAQRWVDAYVAAWRSNDAAEIAALFTEDATYRFSPWREPLRGVAAIVAAWLDNPDPPDSWKARYGATYIDGDVAIIKGETEYPGEGHRYANLFEVRLIGGKCASFVEWHMRLPSKN